jgi:hypothetical protein
VGNALAPQATQIAATPNIPTGLYPTNTGELALPIPLGWSAISGATRYRLALHDLTDGTFPVDDVYVANNSYTISSLAPGHQFAWDVAACNSAGCSERSANRSFRTAATTPRGTSTLTYDDVILPEEKTMFDTYYTLQLPENVARIEKPNPDAIKRMKDTGHWAIFFQGLRDTVA